MRSPFKINPITALLSVGAGLVLAGFATAADLRGDDGQTRAGTSADAPFATAKVRYDDVDLATEAGARAMARRLQAAASEACLADSVPVLKIYADPGPCVREALDEAARSINAPRLTAALAARSAPLKTADR